MLEMILMALMMRAIQHRPYAERLDSDRLTYAWHDLAWELGFKGDCYLDDPNAKFRGQDWMVEQ